MKPAKFYGEILSGIATGFGKFLKLFKANGFVYSSLTIIIILVAYTLIINPIRVDRIIEKRMETAYQREKQAEAEAMEKRLKADEIVGGIMTKIVDKFPEVKRILLLESHNSVTSTTGTDLLYFSATMEMLTPNSRHLDYISDDLQRQIRHNLMGGLLNTLKYRDYMYYDSVQNCNHPEHRLLIKLKSVGDEEAILIPFKDDDDTIQMVLVISGSDLPVEDIIDYISSFKRQIEACLM